MLIILGDERHLGAQPPAGPPKTKLIEGDAYFSENLLQQADLDPSHSRAAEFSWTSRFQNLKLHAFNSILYNSEQNPRTGSRDIIIFVKLFFEFVGPLGARGKPSTMVTARVASRDTQQVAYT